MKKTLGVILLICFSFTAFAQNWAKSYNKDNQFNIDATVGYVSGICLNPAFEWVIGEFKLGNVPIDFGVLAKGSIQFFSSAGVSGLSWAAGPTFALHLGLKDIPLEFFISAGLCFYGYSLSGTALPEAYPGFGLSFASANGILYHISKEFAILAEFGFLGGFYWGVGARLKL